MYSLEYFVCSFWYRIGLLGQIEVQLKKSTRGLNFVSNRDGLLDHLLCNEGNNRLLFSVSCPIILGHFTNKYHLSSRAEEANGERLRDLVLWG